MMFLLTIPNAVEISVIIAVVIYGCPISLREWHKIMANLSLSNSAQPSAFVAEDITNFMTELIRKAPLGTLLLVVANPK